MKRWKRVRFVFAEGIFMHLFCCRHKTCSEDHVQVRLGVKPSPCKANETAAHCSSGRLMSPLTQPYHMTTGVTWPTRPCLPFPESSEYFIQLQINSNQLVIRAQAESAAHSRWLIKPFRGEWGGGQGKRSVLCGLMRALAVCVGLGELLKLLVTIKFKQAVKSIRGAQRACDRYRWTICGKYIIGNLSYYWECDLNMLIFY